MKCCSVSWVSLVWRWHGFCLSVGARLYRKLKVYLMTEDQLQEHGYPRSNPEAPGRAILYNLPEKKPASDRKSPHSIKHTMIGVLLLHWLCSQLSTKYAADVAQNTRSTPTATVCGKRNVAFTGDSYVDIKVWVFFFCFNSNPVVIPNAHLHHLNLSLFLSHSCWRLGNQLQVLCCSCGSTRVPSVQGGVPPTPNLLSQL